MKAPSRLRLEPKPSRIASIAIVVAAAATTVLMLCLPLDAGATFAVLVVISIVAARGLWRCGRRGVPAIVHIGQDRRLTATARDGRSRDGTILDASYVGARVTTIVWRADRSSRYRPAEALLILPDMLPRDDFRRLRVLLRYGRPIVEEESDEETSGRAAA